MPQILEKITREERLRQALAGAYATTVGMVKGVKAKKAMLEALDKIMWELIHE